MAQYTDADLKELGRKVLAQRDKERKRIEARTSAIKRLTATYEGDFKRFLAEEQARREL